MRGQSIYFIFVGATATLRVVFNLMDGMLAHGLIGLVFDASFPLVLGILGLRYGGDLRRARLLRNFGIAAMIYFSLVMLGTWQIVGFYVGTFLALSASIWYFVGARQNLSAQDPNSLGFLSLEEGEWRQANAFFEQALAKNPADAKAYVGKLCADLRLKREEDLLGYHLPMDGYMNYQKAMEFADETYRAKLERYALIPAEQLERLMDRVDEVRANKDFAECRNLVSELKRLSKLEEAARILRELGIVEAYIEVADYRADINMKFFDCPLCDVRHTAEHAVCMQCGLEFVKSE